MPGEKQVKDILFLEVGNPFTKIFIVGSSVYHTNKIRFCGIAQSASKIYCIIWLVGSVSGMLAKLYSIAQVNKIN